MQAANEKCKIFKGKYEACVTKLAKKESIVSSFFNVIDPNLKTQQIEHDVDIADRCEKVFEDYKLCVQVVMQNIVESKRSKG